MRIVSQIIDYNNPKEVILVDENGEIYRKDAVIANRIMDLQHFIESKEEIANRLRSDYSHSTALYFPPFNRKSKLDSELFTLNKRYEESIKEFISLIAQ